MRVYLSVLFQRYYLDLIVFAHLFGRGQSFNLTLKSLEFGLVQAFTEHVKSRLNAHRL